MTSRCIVVLFVIVCAVATLSTHPWNCHAADRPCLVIKNHLDAIKNLCITRFGEDREKAIIQAKSKLLQDLKALNYPLPEELNALVDRYVTSSILGYDRMRKRGDVKLVKKAQTIRRKIKILCPWE
jgi:hypothetical protein